MNDYVMMLLLLL